MHTTQNSCSLFYINYTWTPAHASSSCTCLQKHLLHSTLPVVEPLVFNRRVWRQWDKHKMCFFSTTLYFKYKQSFVLPAGTHVIRVSRLTANTQKHRITGNTSDTYVCVCRIVQVRKCVLVLIMILEHDWTMQSQAGLWKCVWVSASITYRWCSMVTWWPHGGFTALFMNVLTKQNWSFGPPRAMNYGLSLANIRYPGVKN